MPGWRPATQQNFTGVPAGSWGRDQGPSQIRSPRPPLTPVGQFAARKFGPSGGSRPETDAGFICYLRVGGTNGERRIKRRGFGRD